MQHELFRLATFTSWSASCSVSPLQLSRCGFFYLGTSDAVQCFECKTHLSGYSSYDMLQEMHKQKAPQCQLVNGNTSSNDPLKMLNPSGIAVSGAGRGDIKTDLADPVLGGCNTIHSDPLLEILYAAHKRASSKGVFSSSTDCEIDRLKPDYEKLRRENVRLLTFHDWPSAAQVQPQVLARAGLFYTGMEDRVQCAFCRGFMKNWEPTDVPSVEHKKHFSGCAFVRGQDTGNVPIAREPDNASHMTVVDDHKVVNKANLKIQEQLEVENLSESTQAHTRRPVLPVNIQPPMFPNYANISQRFHSFRKGRVSQGQTAEGLAKAGWFWIGPGDKVLCFQCGGNLRDWEPTDDPWDEHKKWYANCPYIRDHFPTPRIQLQAHEREKVRVENFSNIVSISDRIDDILEPNPSSDSHVTTGVQVEDNGQLNSCKVIAKQPQGTPVDGPRRNSDCSAHHGGSSSQQRPSRDRRSRKTI